MLRIPAPTATLTRVAAAVAALSFSACWAACRRGGGGGSRTASSWACAAACGEPTSRFLKGWGLAAGCRRAQLLPSDGSLQAAWAVQQPIGEPITRCSSMAALHLLWAAGATSLPPLGGLPTAG